MDPVTDIWGQIQHGTLDRKCNSHLADFMNLTSKPIITVNYQKDISSSGDTTCTMVQEQYDNFFLYFR